VAPSKRVAPKPSQRTARTAAATPRTAPRTVAPASYPEQLFSTVAAWSRWLAANHATSTGVAMRIARKGGALTSITYAEALEVALAWGYVTDAREALAMLDRVRAMLWKLTH